MEQSDRLSNDLVCSKVLLGMEIWVHIIHFSFSLKKLV